MRTRTDDKRKEMSKDNLQMTIPIAKKNDKIKKKLINDRRPCIIYIRNKLQVANDGICREVELRERCD